MKQIWVNRSEVRIGDIVLDYHEDGEMNGKIQRAKGLDALLRIEVTANNPLDNFVQSRETRIRVERKYDGLTKHVGETGEVTHVRSLAKMTDGLKASAIFERFQENMRETGNRWTLTSSQKELAQAMWRQELQLKQQAQQKVDADRKISVVMEVEIDD